MDHQAPSRSALSAPTRPAPGTREELIALSEPGREWEFLPAGAGALRIAPGDVGIRFLVARALARVGLRTLAAEQLARLPEPARALPEAARLCAQIEQLADDKEPVEDRLRVARAAADALGARGIELGDALSEWETAQARTERYRASDGNVVWRIGGREEPGDWSGLCDARGDADRLTESITDALATQNAGPITIEGLCPAWILDRLVRALPREATGFVHTLVAVQRDPVELLDGLSMLGEPDARELASLERVRYFVGEHAGRDYAAWARGRFELESLGPVLRMPGVRTPVSPSVPRLAEDARADQHSELARLRVRVESSLKGKDVSYWRERYARATEPGSAEPLRVLIPTCRYTTFVRHSAEDLRRAFDRLGCQTSLLIEPEDGARLSSIAYYREIARFDPDLLVVINYTREGAGSGAAPDNIPFVCWVQDQMPHLLDERVGRAQGPLDFLCGHVYPALFERFGYPIERALATPVVINAEKFYAEPAPADELERHACEIAFVSHHSETPEDMRDRLIRECADERLGRVVGRVYDLLCETSGGLHERLLLGEVGDSLTRLVRDAFGADPDPGVIGRLKAQCVDTLGERVVRHQTLRWAASIADRRGWRLRIYGRGWEDGPFARFGAGEIEHDESLRACYQAAAVHLHASPSTAVHQRVMECAASGGLAVCRLTRQMLDSQAMAGAALGNAPAEGAGRRRMAVADNPALMDFCAQSQRLGAGSAFEFEADAATVRRQRAMAPTGKLAWTARWLLGDFAETCFWDEASLERLVERAIERPAWRANLSAGIRRRVLERATTDALVDSMLRTIRERLGSGASADAARAA